MKSSSREYDVKYVEWWRERANEELSLTSAESYLDILGVEFKRINCLFPSLPTN